MNSNLGNTQKCVELYDDITKAGIKPNSEIYIIALNQHIKANLIEQPINIFRKMIALKMDPEKKLFEIMVKSCMEKGKDKEAFDFSLSGLKCGYKFDDEMYNVLVDNLLNNEKCKTQEKFDFLNRLNKEIKYKGIKLNQNATERSSKFIIQNKVVKPSLYTSNSLYCFNNQENNNPNLPNSTNNQITKAVIPVSEATNAETAEKKKKKKKKKNKKTEDKKGEETIKPTEVKYNDYFSTDNNNKYANNYNYYNNDDYYPKSYNSKVYEKSVYTAVKKTIVAIDFKRGEYYKR